jgi:hypothetical protein
MKHDTSSAVAEAALWTMGCGISGEPDPLSVGFALENNLFVAS